MLSVCCLKTSFFGPGPGPVLDNEQAQAATGQPRTNGERTVVQLSNIWKMLKDMFKAFQKQLGATIEDNICLEMYQQ